MNADGIVELAKTDVEELLNGMGLSLPTPGHPKLIDFSLAETAYIHHSSVPVAVVGYAQVLQSLARGRFAKFSFIDMMDKRSRMDEREACAVAYLCGADVTLPFWGNPVPFTKQLVAIIDKYELWRFFERNSDAEPGTPYEIQPVGSGVETDSATLKQWRADFKKLPDVRKMMVLAILGLYNATACKEHWLFRAPKAWHAADGIQILRESNALRDWAVLFATYPGW